MDTAGATPTLSSTDALHYLGENGLIGKHKTIEFPGLPVVVEKGEADEMDSSSSSPASEQQQQERTSTPASSLSSQVSNRLSTRPRVFLFSTFDEAGASRIAVLYREYLTSPARAALDDGCEGQFLDDLVRTLAYHRTVFPWRFSVVADSVADLAVKMEKHAAPVWVGPSGEAAARNLGLVFTGHGAQWFAMGRELLQTYPVFEMSLLAADEYLRGLGCGWSLVSKLSRSFCTFQVHVMMFN